MKKYIITAICMAAAVATHAQSDATLNSVTETYTLKPDGSVDYDFSKSITYHSHYSFFSLFGETFVVYNPEYQKLKINDSYTVQKNGKKIVSPANAFNEVLPSAAANSEAYNGLKEMVITHTGLEPDATTYLSYTIEGTPEGAPTLDIDRIIPVAGADIKEYKIVVNVPDGVKLNWSLNGSGVKPVINGNTYTWTFHNVPVRNGEPNDPVNNTGLPRLSVTSAGTLEEALRPLTMETMDICRVPGNVLDGKNTTDEKIAAVQKFIVENIALGGVTPDMNGNRIRQCRAVMESAYGNEAEKASAMAKLLRGEGIDAQMVVAFPKEIEAKNIRNISKYLVKVGDRMYAVDKTGEYNASLRADRDVIYDLGGKLIPVDPVVVKIDCSADIALNSDSVSLVKEDCSATGLDGKIEMKNGGDMTKRGSYSVYTVPFPSQGVDNWGLTSQLLSKRKDLFEIPFAVDETCVYRISLNGMKSLTKNNSSHIRNGAGELSLSIENKGDVIEICRSIKLDRSVYEPSDYESVKKLLLEWLSPTFRSIVLK